MDNFYIYYRIDPAQRAAMLAAVSRHFAQMKSQGFEGQLMARTDDPKTWMEVFEAVADAAAFRQALADAANASGLTALLPEGERRHIEHFRPLKPD